MSAQNDFIPGFDITSIDPLVGITQAQLQQAIAQVEPLDNIGLNYYSATEPDVFNNPRFKRYVWIDITDPTNPVLKRYKVVAGVGSWSEAGVGTAAITASMLANFAVSVLQSDAATSKMALRQDGAADTAQANFVIKVDADGQYLEAVSLNAFLQAAGPIQLQRLSVTGGADYYVLNIVGGIITWRAFDPSTGIVNNSLPAAKLANSTPYYTIGASAAGVFTAQQFDPANMISVDGLDVSRIPLTKLQGLLSGAVAGDSIELSAGGNWVKKTPAFKNIHTSSDTSMTAADSQIIVPTAHNLGVVPTNINIFFVCKAVTANTGSYATGDVIPASCLIGTLTDAATYPFIEVAAGLSTYVVNQRLAVAGITKIGICPKIGGAILTPTVTQFIADFNVRITLAA